MPDEILDFLRNLVFGFTGILWKPISSRSDSDGIGVNERMNEITQGIQYTTSHPNISLIIDEIFGIRVNNFWRSVHWCCHAFNILLDGIIIFFADFCKIINLFST